MIISFLTCVAVFLPWQLYILWRFPVEANTEFAYNSKHIFHALENHGGGYLFYFYKLRQYFGLFTWKIFLIGAVIFPFMKTDNRKIKILLLTVFYLIFLFFSVVVKTKMQSYLFVVAPIGFIFMAYALVKPVSWVPLPAPVKLGLTYSFLILCIVFLFNYPGITNFFHNQADPARVAKKHNTEIYKNLYRYLQPDTKYVLNLGDFSEVELMFYNKGMIAYHGKMEEKNIDVLVNNKIKAGVFKAHGIFVDDKFVSRSPSFYLIDAELQDP